MTKRLAAALLAFGTLFAVVGTPAVATVSACGQC